MGLGQNGNGTILKIDESGFDSYRARAKNNCHIGIEKCVLCILSKENYPFLNTLFVVRSENIFFDNNEMFQRLNR